MATSLTSLLLPTNAISNPLLGHPRIFIFSLKTCLELKTYRCSLSQAMQLMYTRKAFESLLFILNSIFPHSQHSSCKLSFDRLKREMSLITSLPQCLHLTAALIFVSKSKISSPQIIRFFTSLRITTKQLYRIIMPSILLSYIYNSTLNLKILYLDSRF